MDGLRETPRVRQIGGEPFRRWFSSLDLDLIVWLKGQELVGFQLCYDKQRSERAITWREGRGFDHARVDDGESGGAWSKGTPLLVADGKFDHERVKWMFFNSAEKVPRKIRGFVMAALGGYPGGARGLG